MSIAHQRKMSACQQLQQEFLLLFILFFSVWCATNPKIFLCRGCPYKNGSDYFDGETEGKDITFGDCSFENNLCNYTQACTSGSAKNWTVLDGRAVCLGSGDVLDSFSVLLSPLLNITRNTSLVFNYSRGLPATLSVFVATSTEITEMFPEQTTDASPPPVIYINPSAVKIGFRARRADVGYNVTLSYVKLQAAPSTDLPTHVTYSGTPSTCYQSTSSSTTQPDGQETQKQEDSSNAGVIAGVLVAVVVVVAAGVVGIFIWRRHKQRRNRNSGQETVKGELNIYQSADVGVMTTAATMPSPNKSLTKSAVNHINTGNKATPGVMGSSSNQYDVPRNGLPVGRRVVKDEQSGPPDLTSPFAGDCEEDGYHILEDDSAMGASQATGVYSLARNEDTKTLIANEPDGHYDKADSSGGLSPWQGEMASDYNHIVSADRTKEKGRHFEDNKKLTPTYSLATGIQDNGFNENTSRDDEDGYSVLCDGNTQPRGVNGQQATEAYDHIGGDFHGDYDRIRQGDSKDVIGSDYDHVI